MAGFGRDPEHVKITHLVNTVAAATKTEAEDKWAVIEKLPLEIDALSLLSEALNFDFATKGMDEAFTDAEMAEMSGLQAIRDRVVHASGKKNPTVREFIHFSGRGRVHHPIVGGPKEVADRLEQWFVAPACDGFVVSATHVPGAYEDFVPFRGARSCSAAACSARTTRAPRCARISACRCRRSAPGASRDRYSITSSASASSLCETSMPSALAVLVLITNSNLADCTTGSSPGLAPLRI